MRVAGNLQGLKPSQLERLERLSLRRTDRDRLIGVDLARELGETAWELGRNVGVLLDRAGHVVEVTVGDVHGVPLGELGATPQPGRLRGLRLVRTELRGERPATETDREQLARHRLDACVRLVLDEVGDVLWVLTAFLDPQRMDGEPGPQALVGETPRRRLTALPDDFEEWIAAIEEELARRAIGLHAVGTGERALVVVVHDAPMAKAQVRMAEMLELARSAYYDVVAHAWQRRRLPSPRTYIGSGKVAELAQLAVQRGAQVLILDQELSGVQRRNLEERLGMPAIDRTDLVLRVFEKRAKTRAAKLRVRLARLRYEMPRLVQREHGLSRIGRSGTGGAGTKGKGERRVDVERRLMRERIHRLESQLDRVAAQQKNRRRRRESSGRPTVALVGYANAGKSSWLNALTSAEAAVEDRLFVTLDTTVRRTRLSSGREILVSDTVGFLRDLPGGLVDAFRSTLEEVVKGDLLVHVVDVSAEDWLEKEEAVLATLEELGAAFVPRLTLYNKADRVDRELLAPVAARRGGRLVSVLERADRVAVRDWIDAALGERSAAPVVSGAPAVP